MASLRFYSYRKGRIIKNLDLLTEKEDFADYETIIPIGKARCDC